MIDSVNTGKQKKTYIGRKQIRVENILIFKEKKPTAQDMENSPKLERMPLSVDLPPYRQKPPFQNGESWQL